MYFNMNGVKTIFIVDPIIYNTEARVFEGFPNATSVLAMDLSL